MTAATWTMAQPHNLPHHMFDSKSCLSPCPCPPVAWTLASSSCCCCCWCSPLWRRQERHGIPTHVFRLAGIYGPGRSALDAVARCANKRCELFALRCRTFVGWVPLQALRAFFCRVTGWANVQVIDNPRMYRRLFFVSVPRKQQAVATLLVSCGGGYRETCYRPRRLGEGENTRRNPNPPPKKPISPLPVREVNVPFPSVSYLGPIIPLFCGLLVVSRVSQTQRGYSTGWLRRRYDGFPDPRVRHRWSAGGVDRASGARRGDERRGRPAVDKIRGVKVKVKVKVTVQVKVKVKAAISFFVFSASFPTVTVTLLCHLANLPWSSRS